MYTAAYDGIVRRMDPAQGEFELLAVREDSEFSAFDCTTDGNSMLLGDKDGDVEVVDARDPSKGTSINLHDRKINTLHVRSPSSLHQGMHACDTPWTPALEECFLHGHAAALPALAKQVYEGLQIIEGASCMDRLSRERSTWWSAAVGTGPPAFGTGASWDRASRRSTPQLLQMSS